MDAVIYARYSSDNQREESIDAQIRAVREYAKNNSINIVNIYTDEAKSAKTDQRPGFLKLIEDSKSRLFNAVIVHKLDRFSRNREDSAIYKFELKKNGVRLISAVERLDDSPESSLFESLIEGMNEYYSKNLAREVMKGMKETAYQCKHNGGLPPLGYDVAYDKTLIINESEKKAVILIYDLYVQGYGYNHIINELNKNGYKTKTGKCIGKNSIHNILRNEKYTGVYIFNKTYRQSAGMNIKKFKDEDDIIRIKGGIPQIIDLDTWKKVQERMDKNKKSPGANGAKEIYLLSGLIFCAECGGAMVGNRKKAGRNKEIYISYECSTRKRTKQCNAKSINKDFIEDIVIEDLIDKVLSPNNLKALSKELYEYSMRKQEQIHGDIKIYEKELKEITKQINNIVNAIAKGMSFEAMKEKMEDLENRKNEITTNMHKAKLQIEKYRPKIKDIENYIKKDFNIRERNQHEQKKIINNYIEKVLVFEDEIEVQYIVDLHDGGGPQGANPLNPYNLLLLMFIDLP